MKLKKWILGAAIAAPFLVGTGWGFWSRRQETKLGLPAQSQLTVLCPSNWFSNALLDKFAIDHSLKVRLWTYDNANEFLRQMASANGHVDVICTSSLIIRDLVKNNWIAEVDFMRNLPGLAKVSADFLHLSYDPELKYSVPVFWSLYGWLMQKDIRPPGPAELGGANAWLELAPDLGLFALLNSLEPVHRPSKISTLNLRVEDLSIEPLKKYRWTFSTLAKASEILNINNGYHFELAEIGSFLEIGVLAIGARSENQQLAKALMELAYSDTNMNHLLKHQAVGSLLNSSEKDARIGSLRKPSALRLYSLKLIEFPELSSDAIPQFHKYLSESQGEKP